VAGAVASSRQEEFGVVGDEVIPIEGGLHQPSSQPWDGIVMLRHQSLDVAMLVVSGYNPEFLHDLGSRHMWAVIEVGGWRSWVWFIWHRCLWRSKVVGFWEGGQLHFRVPDRKQLIDVGRG
jgi:hypothetical protein